MLFKKVEEKTSSSWPTCWYTHLKESLFLKKGMEFRTFYNRRWLTRTISRSMMIIKKELFCSENEWLLDFCLRYNIIERVFNLALMCTVRVIFSYAALDNYNWRTASYLYYSGLFAIEWNFYINPYSSVVFYGYFFAPFAAVIWLMTTLALPLQWMDQNRGRASRREH